MNLDRFTQKAQESIVEAQRLAEELQSPVLDSEHLLAALVEADDGIPAETLRRLGVDMPAFRGELAAALNKRAKIQGGSLTADPRVRHAIERASDEAKRLKDDYVSTEHLLLAIAEGGGEAQQLLDRHGANREAILQALAGVRGSQRVTSPNPESTYRPSRSTAATSPPRLVPASSIRSSAATRRSAASSRSCPAAPRTTRC